MELTVVMPCLNEAETVATCVRKAVQFIADSGISGEVVVADNGSTDGSRQLAADAVCDGLASGDLTERTLGKWGPDFRTGMDRMRRLVVEYYEGFSFGRFVKGHPHLKGHLTDLLIGNLFNDHVGEVFPLMDELKASIAAERAATA